MAELLVGGPECSFHSIIKVLCSPSLSSKIENNWRNLARAFEEPLIQGVSYQQSLQLEKLQKKDIVEELLLLWVSRMGKNAKLTRLIEIIGEIPGCNAHADALFHRFREIILQNISWHNLSLPLRSIILKQNVAFLGNRRSINDICCGLDPENFDTIIDSCRQEIGTWNIDSEIILAQSPELDTAHSYYMSRTLVSRANLDPKIFSGCTQDIFCFRGLTRFALTTTAGNEQSDISRKQIKRLTAHFILLEQEEHFDEICVQAKCPVHWINFRNGKYTWIRTFGSIRSIQGYLHEAQETIEDGQLADLCNSENTKAHVCIVDTPGMGKSALLEHLARDLIKKRPQDIIICCKAFEIFSKVDTLTTDYGLKRAICEYVSGTKLGREILFAIMNSNSKYQIHFFLDAIDQVKKSGEFVMETLRRVRTFQNFRLYVSSRPHFRTELEETLSTLSYSILPLPKDDQIHLLVERWKKKHKIEANARLTEFARHCITALNSNMTDSDREIAGNPLQCVMLADIYCNDANNESRNQDQDLFEITVDVDSFFKMYKRFMTARFNLLEPQERRRVRNVICHLGYKHIFEGQPLNIEVLDLPLKDPMITNVPWKEIMTLGIIEKCNDNVRFVHDTFAEFLSAEYFVTNTLQVSIVKGCEPVYVRPLVRCLFSQYVKNTWNNYNFPIENQYWDIINFMATLPFSAELTKHWEPLALALGISRKHFPLIESNISKDDPEPEKRVLNVIFHFWTRLCPEICNYDVLINRLEASGFDKVSEILRDYFYEIRFKNPSFWYFLDAFLAKYTDYNLAIPSMYRLFENKSPLRDVFYFILYTSANYGFGNLSQVMSQLMLSECTEMDIPANYKKWTNILVSASENCSLEHVKYLCSLRYHLGHSTYLDFTNDLRARLLRAACRSGKYDMVEYLLKSGANFPNIYGLAHWCVKRSNRNSAFMISQKKLIIELFLQYNSDCLKELDSDGSTPLQSYKVHVELMKFLIIRGSDPFAGFDQTGQTFLHRALQWNCISANEFGELVNLLVFKHGAIFGSKYNQSENILSLALFNFDVNVETIQQIVDCSADYDILNEYDETGDTVIHKSILGGRGKQTLEAIGRLGGCWRKRTQDYKYTAVHLAAQSGNDAALRHFLSEGAEVDAATKNKQTPLHVALTKGWGDVHQVVVTLLENGANVNAIDVCGYTPLRHIFDNKYITSVVEQRTIDLLREKGAMEYYNDKCVIL